MIPALSIILGLALLDWIALARGWRRVEVLAKPAVTLGLFLFLLAGAFTTGFRSLPLLLFAIGMLFSLAGDILLLSERWFVPGLAAFLLAHLAYIVGFNLPLPQVSLTWSLGIALLLAVTVSRVLRRILSSLRAEGQNRMVLPVLIYALVMTVTLLSAMLTLFRLDWLTISALLAALGVSLFYFSDLLLAWHRFVSESRNSPLVSMVLYHLGQILLAAGVMLQFIS